MGLVVTNAISQQLTILHGDYHFYYVPNLCQIYWYFFFKLLALKGFVCCCVCLVLPIN